MASAFFKCFFNLKGCHHEYIVWNLHCLLLFSIFPSEYSVKACSNKGRNLKKAERFRLRRCFTQNGSVLKVELNLHYTRAITWKRVTSGGAGPRGLAPKQYNFEETSQRWRAVGDTVSDLADPGIEPFRAESDVLSQSLNFLHKWILVKFWNLSTVYFAM